MNYIGQLMKQAQQMQAKMEEIQKELENTTVEGTAGGGMVTATVTGKGVVKTLKIDPSLVDKDEVEMLEDLIIAALNDAKSKAEERAAEEMSKLTGGFQLPEGMKLPF